MKIIEKKIIISKCIFIPHGTEYVTHSIQNTNNAIHELLLICDLTQIYANIEWMQKTIKIREKK